MELLFESRLEITRIYGRLRTVQHQPQIMPEPVVSPTHSTDAGGCTIYGTVLHDGGRYRMWYQAWPKDRDGRKNALVAYAESDNGLDWQKPTLNLVDRGGLDNNLCDLGFASPSVFIDPHAEADFRYRAVGCCAAQYMGAHPHATSRGYYTAHSADGLHWTLDSTSPTWKGTDVVTSIYHPARRGGLVAMKYYPRACGFGRRAIWTATMDGREYSVPSTALVPDDFDDVAALARGFASGDYYGMGMLPAGKATVGFLWQFRHQLPRTEGGMRDGRGIFGIVDVSLAYQPSPGECWMHQAGRPDFLSHGTTSWSKGGLYTASNPIEVGDEHWLYITGSAQSHGWYLDAEWKNIPERQQHLIDNAHSRIGIAHWPKWRLFGFQADPQGELDIDLGVIAEPVELVLNYQTEVGGSIRVRISSNADLNETNAVAMTGDSIGETVAWKNGTIIPPADDKPVVARLFLDRASVWAYELRPVR